MGPSKNESKKRKVDSLDAFNSGVLKKAVVALLKYFRDNKLENDLLDTRGAHIMVQFDLAKIPPGVMAKPLLIDLPYPTHLHPDSSVCLITRDPQTKFKTIMKSEWKSAAIGMETPKVIGLSKLKKNYPTMGSKRELSRTYDLFLCDRKVIDQMPRILGRTFVDAGKLPIEVPVKEKSLLDHIMPRLKQTFMKLRTGPSVSVKVGRANDSAKNIYQNALSVIDEVARFFNPSESEVVSNNRDLFRDNQIRSIHLIGTNSPPLRVYIHPTLSEAVETALNLKKCPSASDEVENQTDKTTLQNRKRTKRSAISDHNSKLEKTPKKKSKNTISL